MVGGGVITGLSRGPSTIPRSGGSLSKQRVGGDVPRGTFVFFFGSVGSRNYRTNYSRHSHFRKGRKTCYLKVSLGSGSLSPDFTFGTRYVGVAFTRHTYKLRTPTASGSPCLQRLFGPGHGPGRGDPKGDVGYNPFRLPPTDLKDDPAKTVFHFPVRLKRY